MADSNFTTQFDAYFAREVARRGAAGGSPLSPPGEEGMMSEPHEYILICCACEATVRQHSADEEEDFVCVVLGEMASRCAWPGHQREREE